MGKGVLLKIYSNRDDFSDEKLDGKRVSDDGRKASHESVEPFCVKINRLSYRGEKGGLYTKF